MGTDRSKNKRGFSLVELMIVCVIATIVVGILFGIIANVTVNSARQTTRTEAVNDAAAALDMMTMLIRMAGNNPKAIPNLQPIAPGPATIGIVSDWRGNTMDSFPDGAANDPFENVTFSVANGKLMKQEQGEVSATVFLDNVNSMAFTYYTSENALIDDPPNSLALIARVDISLVMQARDGVPTSYSTSAFVRQR